MNIKLLLSIFAIINLLSVLGCSGSDETNRSTEVDNTPVEASDGKSTDYSPEITKKPPALIFYVGKETIRPARGTYSWSYDNGDGTATGINADSSAPPQLVKEINPVEVTAGTNVELDFEKKPDSYTVRKWDDDNSIISESDEIVLSGKGKVVYEIQAHWEQGTASYAFSLNIE